MTAKRRPIDPRPGDELAKLLHQRGAQWGLSWSVAASEAERATELLWNRVEKDLGEARNPPVGATVPNFVVRPTMLLAALTIENLLKGVCVSQEPALNEKGRFRLKTHKLLDLLDRIKVPLNDEEQDLVERLEVLLEWAGRYPVPLTHRDMLPRTDPSGGFGLLTHLLSSNRVVWRRLVRRFDNLLKTALSKTGPA